MSSFVDPLKHNWAMVDGTSENNDIGFECPRCHIYHSVYATCEQVKSSVVATYGWLCHKCGRSNAPWVAMCPCGPNVTITTGDSTS